MRFTIYTRKPLFIGLSEADLIAEQKKDRMLWANVEHSGSEGVYVEVAKWNDPAHQWQRYAFCKFEDANDPEATALADRINEPLAERPSFIHGLPEYDEAPVTVYALEATGTDYTNRKRVVRSTVAYKTQEVADQHANEFKELCAKDKLDGSLPITVLVNPLEIVK
jgi:hypothetical protein